MTPHDAFDRILASLYEAALDDARWPAASALIEEAVGTDRNVLSIGEGSDHDARVDFSCWLSRGDSCDDLGREYFNEYFPHDEAVPRILGLPHGQLREMRDFYSEDERKTSLVYNEGLLHFGDQNGLCTRFDGPDGQTIVWSVGSPFGHRGWQSAELRLLERLLPHVRRSVLIRQALASADALGASLTDLLDNSRIGVLHLDRLGRVLAANDPALAVLRAGDGLFDQDGALHARLPQDQERLQRLLGRALPSLWSEPPTGGSMTVGRPSQRTRLGLHVSPVGDARADFGARRVAALVLVVDPASTPRIDPVRVSSILGLTPSEGRVAALLAEGNSVPETAAAAGYQANYVRWLIQRLYKKQGVSGQVALVRRVLAANALPRR